MAVTVLLSTSPGSVIRGDRWTSKTIELFGKSFGSKILSTIRTVADIKAAVVVFGARVRACHPEASFYVSVRLAKDCRKPGGYDAAAGTNGFGQNDFMHVRDKRTKPAPSEAVGMNASCLV